MESSDFSSADTNAGASEGMSTSSAGMNNSSASNDGTEQSGGLADRARGALGNAGEKLSGAGSTLREKAGGAKDSLANALESGAEKLRARGDGAAVASLTGESVAVADDRMSQVTSKVAGGMEGAADWLRDADLDGLKATIEQQVKEHPGRTLLIAAGLGYLLGKALRK
jgi:ElaB/YqjD/DUF883 family membrane-anchored ribosome-binding protein